MSGLEGEEAGGWGSEEEDSKAWVRPGEAGGRNDAMVMLGGVKKKDLVMWLVMPQCSSCNLYYI